MTKTPIASLGIIGTGSFGRFSAKVLEPYFEVRLVGRASSDPEFELAAQSDYVMLAVPFDGYHDTLARLAPILRPKTVIIDVCSVKIQSIDVIRAALPGQPLLATHPLFGPQSAGESLAGHDLILCPQPQNEELEARATEFFQSLGLRVTNMPAEGHDRLMADLHGLTFFVARALALYGIAKRDIMTPSYKKLMYLADLENHHSPELFATIQMANPYTSASRDKFMKIAEQLADSLKNNNHGK